MKTVFQIQFFSEPRSIKRSFYSYKISYCVFCTANIKADAKQTQPKPCFPIANLESNQTLGISNWTCLLVANFVWQYS
jgi:hypothetical protein